MPACKDFEVLHFITCEQKDNYEHEYRRGERIFICNYDNKQCRKIFNSAHPLFGHLMAHTGEKPFKCSFGCGKSFSQVGNKNKHEYLTHKFKKEEDENYYKCEICTSKFKQQNNLKLHYKRYHKDINQ